MNTLSIITIVIVILLSGYIVYQANKEKRRLSNIAGIVVAGCVATMSGLISGYLISILSEDIFLATGIGIIIGFFTGFLAGQPAGIMAILAGVPFGLLSGIAGAAAGINLKIENPFLMLLILLVFYVMIMGLVIIFIRVETDDQFVIDTLAISPFTIISAGIVMLSLFLFLYSSDTIKVTSKPAQAQTNNANAAGMKNDSLNGNSAAELDITNEKKPIIQMEVTQSGYSPNVIRLKKGIPVSLEIHNPLENSCLSVISIPAFHIHNNLKAGTTIIHFTPLKTGKHTFSCGMNMFKGTIIVE